MNSSEGKLKGYVPWSDKKSVSVGSWSEKIIKRIGMWTSDLCQSDRLFLAFIDTIRNKRLRKFNENNG